LTNVLVTLHLPKPSTLSLIIVVWRPLNSRSCRKTSRKIAPSICRIVIADFVPHDVAILIHETELDRQIGMIRTPNLFVHVPTSLPSVSSAEEVIVSSNAQK
jgi:hypothetical protein